MSKKKVEKKEKRSGVSEYIIFFFVCSFFGWIYEVCWEIFVWGRGFVNRGTMYGPWIPVYGIGGVLIAFFFYRFIKGKDIKRKLLMIIPLFIGIFILTSVVELITSYMCDIFMGYFPWDYTHLKYHLDGRVALMTSSIFGVGGLFFVYILKPLVDKVLSKLSSKNVKIITLLLVVIFVIDFICSQVFERNKIVINEKDAKLITVKTETDIMNMDELKPYEFVLIDNIDEYNKLFPNNKVDLNFNDNIYIAFTYMESCGDRFESIKGYSVENNSVKLYMNINPGCGVCAPAYTFYLAELPRNEVSKKYKVNVENIYTDKKYCDPNVSYKPMIYIYPDKDMNVSIKVSNPELLTTTYPKYNNEWNVFTKKDGTLIMNEREYYGLYWEGKRIYNQGIKDGFVVERNELILFLEEKLEILGLNEREANEFIVYWLPILEKSEYNYIRFETIDEINANMELEISPRPDTLIRIMMDYKPLDKPIHVQEQVLTKQERTGYTVVEWGGTNI